MSAASDHSKITSTAHDYSLIKPIDIGFRWIDGTFKTLVPASDSDLFIDISIELKDRRQNANLQLKITTDTGDQEYKTRKDEEGIIRRVSNAKIPCERTKVIEIELFEYRRKYVILKEKLQVFSMKVSLNDDVLYTKTSSGNGKGGVTITFAYTLGGPGAELRKQVERARKITEEEKVLLDKIRHVHRFFEHLDVLCNSVKEIHKFIEAGCNAFLLLYRLCEKQRECHDAAQKLVDEMDDILTYGMEALAGLLKKDSNTKKAFASMVGVIEKISKAIDEENKGTVRGFFRDAFSTGYESKLEELRGNFRRAKEGLRDSINFGTWERVIDTNLRAKLESVPRAHYSSGDGCLKNTRESLLADVDSWVRGSSSAKTTWVHGHAGSGKSALLNSIAELFENAHISFTCFPCKRDDPDLSDIHRVLPTIAYHLTERHGGYRGFVSNLVDQPEGRSALTGDVRKQIELLFGEECGLIPSKGANQPAVHVILVDALDECRNHRDGGRTIPERRALLRSLIWLAHTIPWIKVLITSRPEPDIFDVFKKTTSPIHDIDINADKWKTSADTRLFIKVKSDELELDLSSDEIDHLNDRASGLFVWCATVFRYIESSKKSRKEHIDDILHSSSSSSSPSSWSKTQEGLFDSLYALYQRVLDSAVLCKEDRSAMELILSIIFIASNHRPLSADAIADILYSEDQGERKRTWVRNIVESLSAIVYVEEGTYVVRAYHPSALDFIGGMLTGIFPFSVKLEQAHACVFEGCFSIMNRDLRFNICELEDSFRMNKDVPDLPTRIANHITEALQYASLFWFSHLEKSDSKGSDVQVLAFLNSLHTLYWAEALSLLGIVDRGIVILQDCAHFFTDQPSIAEIAGEWERFLLACGDASRSTPHLYLSALSWLPSKSRLWDIVCRSFSPALPMISNVPEAWNSERWSENVGSMVWSVAYSANGRLFAAGGEDGRVRLWEARSGKPAREPFITDSKVRSIAFSTDNCWLASGHSDNNVRLWDLRNDSSAIPRVLKGHTRLVTSVAFSSTGARIVSGSDDNSIRVWDVELGTAIGIPFTGHDGSVYAATFCVDDRRIVSTSWDYTVRIWDLETGEQVGKLLQDRSNIIYSVACSLDGKFIASGSSDRTIRLWDAQTFEQIGDPLAGHNGYVRSVCFSADGKRLVSGSSDHSLRIWDVETRSLICKLGGHTSNVEAAVFSPDGSNVVSGSSDNTVRVWDTKEIASSDQLSAGSSAQAYCVAYVPNSNLIVYRSNDGIINLRDTHIGAAVGKPMQTRTGAVSTLAVSNSGQWLVSESIDKTLRTWDIASGAPLGEPLLGHTGVINSVAVSPDDHLIASASNDKTVRLWNVAERQLMMVLEGHEQRVASVTFSMDGNYVISGSGDCSIRLWDTQTGETVGQPLKGHSGGVISVAVSPDGQWIATGSQDKTVRIWSMSTLSEAHVLEGHSELVLSVAFSRDSQFLVSGSGDYTARVWNVQTGEAVGDPLTGHTGWIRSIAFSIDGQEFASGSQDGTIRVWDTRARTDLGLYRESEIDYAELDGNESRVLWDASRASASVNDGWIKDGEKLLLWVPLQYRHDINGGTKLVIGAQGENVVRVEADYRKVFKFSGSRWKNIQG